MIDEHRGAFMCRLATLAFWAASGPFRGLLLTVLGPQTDFIVVEPQGAHTCRSSTLTFLADSILFRGLLLIVLGSQSDFHD